MDQTDQTIKMWAIIDLYGHQQIAGLVTEQTIASQGFIRVDVPATDGQPAYTRLFGSGAIYAIQPTDEATVLKFLAYRHEPPINPYILEAHTRSHFDEDEEDSDL